MNSHSFELARQYAHQRLERELTPHLLYHGLVHTRDDVVPCVERLAEQEGVKGRPLELALTAAWFHDLGFVRQPAYHELIGARIAGEVLPEFGYNARQVEVVQWAIYATIIPQAPNNPLEGILADADLNVLGRENFLARNRMLRQELANFGKVYSDVVWFSGQLKFIETHQFFTASAREQLDSQKALNTAALRQHLAEAMQQS